MITSSAHLLTEKAQAFGHHAALSKVLNTEEHLDERIHKKH